MKIRFLAFNAIKKIELWRDYMEGHANVLRDFGITSLTSHKNDWIENPNVFVIVAINEEEKLIGGIKLHTFHEDFKLPVEQAIGDLEPTIHSRIQIASKNGVGEICGLWIAKESGRIGMAHFLSRAAISLCSYTSTQTIFGISSPFTLNMFLQLGYEVITELGDNGNFIYPTPDFLSTAVIIKNTMTLPQAAENHRERIQSLRINPIQTHTEDHLGNQITIAYNLSLIQS